MLFNSVSFLVFFPIVIVLYYLTPYRWRWLLLLLASYFFYGSWKIEFLSLIVLSTATDFWIAKRLEQSLKPSKKTQLLFTSLLVNLGMLIFFKYGHFILHQVLDFVPIPDWRKEQVLHLTDFDLPVGISFYTFQTLGYTIDVYFNRAKAEKHLGKFALYVSYFPQLVAGPIERYEHLQPQLNQKHNLTYSNLVTGFRLMLYGFFIKMVIADNLSPIVDIVFEDVKSHNRASILAATFGFGWQIYADFYGYSLIAIGTAKCMGINLMDNFKGPYFSQSIRHFWQSWHISLSTWFRDYLYLPLGGNKTAPILWIRNILLVFIISGIWHGANWTFLIWGGIHGIVYLAERFTPLKWDLNQKLFRGIGWLKTYLIVSVAWVYFRASSVDNAHEVFHQIVHTQSGTKSVSLSNELIVFLLLFLTIEISTIRHNYRFDRLIAQQSIGVRWGTYLLLLFLIWGFAGTTNHPFIYFQF